VRMPITEKRPRFILNLKINDLINARYTTHLQAAAASRNFYGWLRLNGKRLQPARLRNLHGGLQLRETTAAYDGLRRRLRGLR